MHALLVVCCQGAGARCTVACLPVERDVATLLHLPATMVCHIKAYLSDWHRHQVAVPEGRWAALEKYDLFHEALRASSAANPVRLAVVDLIAVSQLHTGRGLRKTWYCCSLAHLLLTWHACAVNRMLATTLFALCFKQCHRVALRSTT